MAPVREQLLPYLVTLLVAWLATDLLIPWVTRLAHRFGRVDQPDERKVHTVPMVRLGGVALFAGFALALATVEWIIPGPLFPRSGPFLGLFAGGAIIFLLGMADDLKPLPAKFKLLVQIGAAALAVYLGVKIEFISNPWGGLWLFPPMVAYGISVFWLVGITNTINLIDGLDGLAGGVSLIAAITTALIAYQTHQPTIVLVALALTGAIIGFLRYNWNPAKIFMGDAGSLFLGFTLATLSIIGVLKLVATAALLVPLLILGVPIFDTAFAIVRRAWQRRPIFSPDRGHLHHRLLGLGFSHRRAVIIIYGICLLLGGVALTLTGIREGSVVAATAAALLLWGFSGRFLGKATSVSEPSA